MAKEAGGSCSVDPHDDTSLQLAGDVGTTPDGTVFEIPATHDVVKLLDPSHPKTWLDAPILASLSFHVLLGVLTLLGIVRIPRGFFLILTVFWRLAYNVGLGVILKKQSEERAFVKWAKRFGLDLSDTELDEQQKAKTSIARRTGVWWHPHREAFKFAFLRLLRAEVRAKTGTSREPQKIPVEFTSWMLFRSLVDIILVSDVAAFFVVAVLYTNLPVSPEVASLPPSLTNNLRYFASGVSNLGWTDLARFAGGAFVSFFSLWVKMDAHRVVKDFAWYWGDFFFLKSSSLVFDGAFDIWYHPMYTLGYAHYYAATLVAKSYTVLFVSLFAHAAQMAFLYAVENPHIDKIYGTGSGGDDAENKPRRGYAQPHELRVYFRRDLVVLNGFDAMRAADLFSAVIVGQAVVASLLVGRDKGLGWLVGQALFWRTLYTYGTGAILYYQSKNRFWNRHFVRHGEGLKEGFDNWKSLYNLLMIMTYVTFFLLAFRLYEFPGFWLQNLSNWTKGDALLRHIVGIGLIALHVWTAASIYEALGVYGWFYGDFFLPPPSSGVKYTGIYRYLNNPEKVVGQAYFWGLSLLCGSWTLFFISLFGHISSFLFLEFVERPHMLRVYGQSAVRDLSGIERAVLREVHEVMSSPAVAPLLESVTRATEIIDANDIQRRVEDIGKDILDRLRVEVLERVEEEALRSSRVPRGLKDIIKKRRNRNGAHDAAAQETAEDGHGWTMGGSSPSSDYSSEGEDVGSQSGLRRRRAARPIDDATDKTTPKSEEEYESAGSRPGELTDSPKRTGIPRISSLADILASLVPTEISRSSPPNYDRTIYGVHLQSADDIVENVVPRVLLGTPLRFRVTVPVESLSAKDWLGIYRVGSNPHQHRTTVPSGGKWVNILTSLGVGESVDDQQEARLLADVVGRSKGQLRVRPTVDGRAGVHYVDLEVVLSGDKLPWEVGLWEARLHRNGGYECVHTSAPFEIDLPKVSLSEEHVVAAAFLPVVRRCLKKAENGDRPLCETQLALDTDIAVYMDWPVGGAPATGRRQKQKEEMSSRIVYAIQCMTGVEFSWQVVDVAGTVGELAKKAVEAHSN